ncbi:MAG: peptidylprolyl isomerase [Kofleriaceae bacterium]
MRILRYLVVLVAVASGCQKGTTDDSANKTGSAGATGSAGSGGGQTAGPPARDIDSKDILARTETATEVQVKHVLIGWKDLAETNKRGGGIDPRAAKRTNEEAAKLAQEVASQLRARPDMIDALVKQHGEDPGMQKGDPYVVTASTGFVPPFKNLALRLKVNEAGIVKTDYGYHVILRLPPPPPDPLQSQDILARPMEPGPHWVQVLVIQWKDIAPPDNAEAQKRTKADADALVKQLLEKARAAADITELMKEYGDERTKQNTRPVEIPAEAPQEPLLELPRRLKIGEAGLYKAPFGWMLFKRVAPPPPEPPDPLESADILARAPVTDKAKVKHILLGWQAANAGDERGKKRDRKTLEKLVKGTVAKLKKKGSNIDALMKELSEDPGSAQTGRAYDAAPDSPLMPAFKNLSLRLKVGEVGVVKTPYGMHIIQRIE